MMRATFKIEHTRNRVRVLEHLGCDDVSTENRGYAPLRAKHWLFIAMLYISGL